MPATIDTVNNCIGKVGFTATSGAAAITIDVANVRQKANIDAQLDATFNYANTFAGQLEVAMRGNVSVTELGGNKLTFTSPTFGSNAPGVDGGTPLPTADSGAPPAGDDASVGWTQR